MFRIMTLRYAAASLAVPAFLAAQDQPAPPEAPATVPAAVQREILNPFYPKPVWRLWAENPAPLTLTINGEQRTFAPPPEESRRYPVFPDGGRVTGMPPLRLLQEDGVDPSVAGFWDDCYMSLDSGHSNLRTPNKQFIIGPKVPTAMSEQLIKLRLAMGANFTSQSYARRGRHIVDDPGNVLNTERFFYFANCVRASPAHASYKDNDLDKVHDDYDGLFAHSFHSVGQSSSEIRALEKMLIAGGCLPRDVKNLLKKHGAYPAALLALFKAALPFTDANGQPLPFEHEMRHRPAYSSSGNVGHPHWCSANVHYHGYDEDLHLANMIEIARNLDAAPPIAILQLVSLSVEKDGETIVDGVTQDKRVKSNSLTQARVWGNPGETLKLVVNLGSSYDLQGRKLQMSCRALYPNQKNIAIEDAGEGKILITAKHDPNLPKGRIPVICVARNGSGLPSNPVFVNFYWNDPDENPDFSNLNLNRLSKEQREQFEERMKETGWKRYPVTVNRRPLVDFGLPGDAIRCRPGETVTLPLSASDPEGFPLAVYRWPGEPGAFQDGAFVYDIPSDAPPSMEAVHLVFSDGTGGYTGRRLEFLISDEPGELAPGWDLTTLENQPAPAVVTVDDEGAITFQPVPRAQSRRPQGTFLYRPLERDGDIVLEQTGPASDSDVTLMLRGGLDDHWRFVGAGSRSGESSATYKTGESSWGATTRKPGTEAAQKPLFYRLTVREKWKAAFVSHDGQTWEQLGSKNLEIENALAGVVYEGGAAWSGRMTFEPASLPAFRIDGDRRGQLTAPLTIEVDVPESMSAAILRYTVDGTNPTPESPRYEDSISIPTGGTHEIRVGRFSPGDGAAPAETVVTVLEIKEPEPDDEKK